MRHYLVPNSIRFHKVTLIQGICPFLKEAQIIYSLDYG